MAIINYLSETRAELKHVSWPTKEQTINFTILVIVVAIVAGIYLGVFDFLFTLLLKNVI